MRVEGNTIFITGGATGIGLALADELLRRGNEVVVCSRTEENLRRAKELHPRINVARCDLSREEERARMHDWIVSSFPDINVLVNNAGIQRMVDLRKGAEDLLAIQRADGTDEIDINFKAYVYMSAHFVPDLLRRQEAAIVNVGSGLGFIPIAFMPVYCATKAAVHSFSVSLRHQLRGSPIRVFEVIPPTVDTDLDKGARARRGQVDRGIPPQDVAKATVAGMERDEPEIAMGRAQWIKESARQNFDQAFLQMNPR